MPVRNWTAVPTDTERAAADTYAALLGEVTGLAAAVESGDWNLAATFAEGIQLRAPHMVAAARAVEAPADPVARARTAEVLANVRRQCPGDAMVAALHPDDA